MDYISQFAIRENWINHRRIKQDQIVPSTKTQAFKNICNVDEHYGANGTKFYMVAPRKKALTRAK